MTKKTLIYIEINNNCIEKVSKEIISHALDNFTDTEIYAVVISDENTIQNNINNLKDIGVNKLFIISDNLFDEFNVCTYSSVLSKLVKDIKPDIMLMGATVNGRELAPRLASKLSIGLTADCTDLQLDENGILLSTRPTYGGKMMATIVSKTLPNFATVRQGAFKLKERDFSKEPDIVYYKADIDGLTRLIEILHSEAKPPAEDWTCAEIIVAGGLGLKSKENFDLIYKLCELIDAKPAASRAAVELGWASHNIQVGQTGSSVSPKLYIALGISGALQHMAGINNADKIIAVNTDVKAPIMSSANYALQGDAVNVLKDLIHRLS